MQFFDQLAFPLFLWGLLFEAMLCLKWKFLDRVAFLHVNFTFVSFFVIVGIFKFFFTAPFFGFFFWMSLVIGQSKNRIPLKLKSHAQNVNDNVVTRNGQEMVFYVNVAWRQLKWHYFWIVGGLNPAPQRVYEQRVKMFSKESFIKVFDFFSSNFNLFLFHHYFLAIDSLTTNPMMTAGKTRFGTIYRSIHISEKATKQKLVLDICGKFQVENLKLISWRGNT